MVHRDPETGKFVSGRGTDSLDWFDTHRILGNIAVTIPAADLSGGTTEHGEYGTGDVPIVDFSDHLESNEVFELLVGHFTTIFAMPTTATAESSGQARVEWSKAPAPSNDILQSTFYSGGSTDEDDGVYDIDVQFNSPHADSVLYATVLDATNSFGDSTNGLGAGSDHDRDRRLMPFAHLFGSGPVFDQDDELHTPGEIHTDNVSDHAVELKFDCVLYGRTFEI